MSQLPYVIEGRETYDPVVELALPTLDGLRMAGLEE